MNGNGKVNSVLGEKYTINNEHPWQSHSRIKYYILCRWIIIKYIKENK